MDCCDKSSGKLPVYACVGGLRLYYKQRYYNEIVLSSTISAVLDLKSTSAGMCREGFGAKGPLIALQL